MRGPPLDRREDRSRDDEVHLEAWLGADRQDAFLLVTVAGDVRVGQVSAAGVIDATARVRFPKTAGLEGPLAREHRWGE